MSKETKVKTQSIQNLRSGRQHFGESLTLQAFEVIELTKEQLADNVLMDNINAALKDGQIKEV